MNGQKLFDQLKELILYSGIKSIDYIMDDLRDYIKKIDSSIRFSEVDLKAIFVQFQTFSAYRYADKIDNKISNLTNKKISQNEINKELKNLIENITFDSSFSDYESRILQNIMTYLKKMNKFNDTFLDEYYKIKEKIRYFIRENYNEFIEQIKSKMNLINIKIENI